MMMMMMMMMMVVVVVMMMMVVVMMMMLQEFIQEEAAFCKTRHQFATLDSAVVAEEGDGLHQEELPYIHTYI